MAIGQTKKKKGVTPMDAALKYLTSRPRTVRETELYLDAQEFGEYEVYQTIERLKELGYLNDTAYAEEFIRTRLATKPLSRRKLWEQLYTHKLDKDVIDSALAAVTDEMEAHHAALTAEKFYRQFEALAPEERKQRVLRRLHGRGYEYEAVRQSTAALFGDLTEAAYRDISANGEAEDEEDRP